MRAVKLFAILFGMLFGICSVQAIDVTTAGKVFRDDIHKFLKEEGIPARVDGEGSLCFEYEGNNYWINIIGEKPFYVQFVREGFDAGNVNKVAVLQAINEVNVKVRAVKCCYYEDEVTICVESYCHISEDFKYVFYKYLNVLNFSYVEVEKQYNSFDRLASSPISISHVAIGITDGNNKTIAEYGNKLYSSQTKYLTPRIMAFAESAGTYDIYCKLYTPSGTLSTGSTSPNGYSWKYSLKMHQGNGTYLLSGWGSDKYGNWPKGDYVMELYYDGILLTTKKFTIY